MLPGSTTARRPLAAWSKHKYTSIHIVCWLIVWPQELYIPELDNLCTCVHVPKVAKHSITANQACMWEGLRKSDFSTFWYPMENFLGFWYDMPNKLRMYGTHNNLHWLIAFPGKHCHRRRVLLPNCYINGCMHLKAIKLLWITEHIGNATKEIVQCQDQWQGRCMLLKMGKCHWEWGHYCRFSESFAILPISSTTTHSTHAHTVWACTYQQIIERSNHYANWRSVFSSGFYIFLITFGIWWLTKKEVHNSLEVGVGAEHRTSLFTVCGRDKW